MAILVDRKDRILIQGITGRTGSRLAERMVRDRTPIVGGVTPGKGGGRVAGVPVYDSVDAARADTGATATFIVVPPPFARDACLEAVEAGVRLVVVYTEGVPLHDALDICASARARGARLLGPNSAGCVTPGEANLSDLDEAHLRPGRVGVVSKSGTLTYEAVQGLHQAGWGESSIVCLGGDPVVATQYAEILDLFEVDPATDGVVLIGEVGGRAELAAAGVIRRMGKPVIAYVAGRKAPPGKRMGHAGAVVVRGQDTAEAKSAALRHAGAYVADQVTQVGALIDRALRGRPARTAENGGRP